MSQLVAITCHFNFSGFSAPRANMCRFMRLMKIYGVPLYGMELYLKGTEPLTKGWEKWWQIEVGPECVMFQKEALLNILEKKLPATVRYVAWIDGDVMFMNAKWPEHCIQSLTHHKACQLFTRVHFTKKDGLSDFMWNGTGAQGKMDLSKAHPGFAWAARRELWQMGALYPYCISGTGDVIIAAALQGCGLPKSFEESLGIDKGGDYFLKWNTRVHNWSKDSVGYLGGDIYHEYHGSVKSRGYQERKDALKNLCVSKHLEMRDDGVLRWTKDAPEEIREYLKTYFARRAEDS